MITIPTWTGLARRAAFHRSSCHDGALNFARRARDTIEGEHADARQTADCFAALARSTLPLGQEAAAGFFQKPLDPLGRAACRERVREYVAISVGGVDLKK